MHLLSTRKADDVVRGSMESIKIGALGSTSNAPSRALSYHTFIYLLQPDPKDMKRR